MSVQVVQDLQEMNFGYWEGLTADEIQQKYERRQIHPHHVYIRSVSFTLLLNVIFYNHGALNNQDLYTNKGNTAR
jgi:hypothetical protein